MVVAPTPAPYIKEMNDAGQFYTNRYLDENIEVAVKKIKFYTDPSTNYKESLTFYFFNCYLC